MKYPTAEKIIEFNFLAITLIKAKKSDKAEVRSRQKIIDVIMNALVRKVTHMARQLFC